MIILVCSCSKYVKDTFDYLFMVAQKLCALMPASE